MTKFTIIPPRSIFGKAKYRLEEDVTISDVVILKGFVTDGATVPRLLWWLFPPISSYFNATLVHDYLLSIGTNRLIADRVFKRVALKSNVSKWVVNTMYASIVIYGFIRKPSDYLTKKGCG